MTARTGMAMHPCHFAQVSPPQLPAPPPRDPAGRGRRVDLTPGRVGRGRRAGDCGGAHGGADFLPGRPSWALAGAHAGARGAPGGHRRLDGRNGGARGAAQHGRCLRHRAQRLQQGLRPVLRRARALALGERAALDVRAAQGRPAGGGNERARGSGLHARKLLIFIHDSFHAPGAAFAGGFFSGRYSSAATAAMSAWRSW